MQVTETVSDGLKREFKVVVPAADLDSQGRRRLDELKDRVRINGFRPGKVPVEHLKRLYGRSVMAETIEAVVREANAKIVNERGFRLVREPQVTMPTEEGEVEQVIEGKSDLAYTVAIEILPAIELADFKGIKLERLVADVTDAEIDEAMKRIAEQNRPFAAKAEGAKAEKGDRVMIDFVGKIDGVPFEGGTGGDVAVQSARAPSFRASRSSSSASAAGEKPHGQCDLPADLSGRASRRQGRRVRRHREVDRDAEARSTIDDEFAKSLGLESLDKLQRDGQGAARAASTRGMSRQKLKRKLLDELDAAQVRAAADLVEDEFNNVWKTVIDDLQPQKRTFADEGTTEEKAKEEYRTIAERRVRLGLVLAEIGEKNNIKVTDEEMTRAVVERARQVPGREQEVWDYYRKNPDAMASLRAPIFEDKVIDFILELAKVTDKTVSREELYKEDED